MNIGWFGGRGSVRRNLIVWNALALAILFISLDAVTRFAARETMLSSVDRELEKRASFIPGGPPRDGPRRDRPPSRSDPEQGRRPPGFDRMTNRREPYPPVEFGPDGKSLRGPADVAYDPVRYAAAKEGHRILSTVTLNGERIRVISVPLGSPGEPRGVIQIAYPLTDVDRTLAGLDATLLALIPVALCLSVAGSVFATGRVLARVRSISSAADCIGVDDLSTRLPTGGSDEFSALSETFNAMLGRLEVAFGEQRRLLELQRRFTADASHELRTPLTIVKGSASMALQGSAGVEGLRKSLEEIDRSADSMARLVNDLLLLARSDGGHLGSAKVVLLVVDVLETAKINGLKTRQGSNIEVEVNDSRLSVLANETDLVRLFSNLVDNAARHGDHVRVVARSVGSDVEIVVADDGPGIDPEHLPHLGERFYRIDESRTGSTGGTGLGLSICLGIVGAYGGSLRIASEAGVGTEVTVLLPRHE